MSFQAMGWAISQKTGSAATKLVLLMLANYAGAEDGAAFPSVNRLAEECELGRRTVQAALHNLEQQGFIEIEGRSRKNGSATSNQYRVITWGAGDAPPPCKSCTPRTYHLEPKKEHTVVSPRVKPSKNDIYLRALEVWRANKREAWTDHRVLPKRAKGQVDELVKAYGSETDAMVALVQALEYARDLSWTDADLSFENLGSNGKLVEYAEKQASRSKKTEGQSNTLEAMRATAKSECLQRDATEREWKTLDEATKMLFVRPGQVRDYRNGRMSGQVFVVRTQGTVMWLRPVVGGQEFIGQLSSLGRETHERAEEADGRSARSGHGNSRADPKAGGSAVPGASTLAGSGRRGVPGRAGGSGPMAALKGIGAIDGRS